MPKKELVFTFNDLPPVALTVASRKELMIDYMKPLLRLAYHNLKNDNDKQNNNIQIGAVMNDKYGPKTVPLRSLQGDTQQNIIDTLNRAQLNPTKKGVGFVDTIKAARSTVFSQDSSFTTQSGATTTPTQKTLITFAGSLRTDGLREEVQKLRESGIKIIFIVVEAYTSDSVEKQLKPMVSFVRISNKVTNDALNEGLDELSKGTLISILIFLRIIFFYNEIVLSNARKGLRKGIVLDIRSL